MKSMITDKKDVITVSLWAAILAWTACSNAPAPTAQTETPVVVKESPPEPVTAQTAFYAMYKPARTWATDLLPLSMSSGELPNLKNEAGKAAMWTAVFVSPSLHAARTFTYAAIDSEGTRKGVTAGGVESWSGSTPRSRPFQTTQFIVNSDAAYQAALVKSGAWLKKHPGKQAAFFLGSSAQFPVPVWYILWGTAKSGYAVYVNATTGVASLR